MKSERHTVSVRELRNSTATVVRQLEDGVEVTLTNRGTPVARLVPLQPLTSGRQLLDAIDRLGPVDTGWATDIKKARTDEVPQDMERW